MDVLTSIAIGIWVFIPALVPNSAAVLFGGGTPVDFGRSWRGRRVLGDGKTWRGLAGGTLTGILVGLLQLMAGDLYGSEDYLGFGPMPQALWIVLVLALGSLLGDMAGAFIKRRMGLERGAKAAGLDQYDFVVGAMLLTLLLFPEWFLSIYVEGNGIFALVALLVAVPVIHRLVNIIGFRKGLKKEPW
ncbi:MAG: CDP-2,3-bis-(O-geranylgeranyl)-sn-glycerol synthase [Methanomassiliicoccales archaeon]|jgi:CDP-2,3-bis-(O-geranylgeranyl)-sn-glycerol synthase|nr:CDP-2,3-bis-(O-geranylgeranyl)-sn-glycerol synthase [Methanomassiliicoccales archaeon]